MSLLEVKQSYLFSSNSANGALNVSPNGSSFDVRLDNPITIPRHAVYANISVPVARIWWTVPNISPELGNNLLYLTTNWQDGVNPPPAGSPNFVITIPKGLYSVPGLQNAISRELVNKGLPSKLISLSGDDATQKIIITYNTDAYTARIDFTQANTLRSILGFNSRLSPLAAAATDGQSDLSDIPATFNTIDSFLISTNLISNGIPVNSFGSGIISNVSISSEIKVGYQIVYEPMNPLTADCSELIGKSRNFFSFQLTDQNRKLVDTNGEFWYFSMVLTYYVPTDGQHPHMNSASWN